MLHQNTPFLSSDKMPILFLGHGSPMYAIEKNEFTDNFEKISQKIPTPQAILIISAHWQTQGTFVTAMDTPKTIHDFYGFPQTLYEQQYKAKGSIELAHLVKKTIKDRTIYFDTSWGLDHGSWSVLKYLYPKADIPVVQLSLDINLKPNSHYQLGKSLYELRNKGILVLGSGNIVHNLRYLTNKQSYAHHWATTTQESVKEAIKDKNHQTLIEFKDKKEFNLSIPTADHFLPLLYIIGLQDNNDNVIFFNEKIVNGGISMFSVGIGL